MHGNSPKPHNTLHRVKLSPLSTLSTKSDNTKNTTEKEEQQIIEQIKTRQKMKEIRKLTTKPIKDFSTPCLFKRHKGEKHFANEENYSEKLNAKRK